MSVYGESIEYASYLLEYPWNDQQRTDAMIESLFTVFAYADPTPSEQNAYASQFKEVLKAAGEKYDVTFKIYQGNLNWRKIGGDVGNDLFTEIVEESCYVGGPQDKLFIQVDGSYSMMQIASDVCD